MNFFLKILTKEDIPILIDLLKDAFEQGKQNEYSGGWDYSFKEFLIKKGLAEPEETEDVD